ncbi:Isoflavone reductase family protein [Mycena venus]|uniref:Isoflavone reductase family protein n=1 Tax=Mycena venus TaxID=2733690 RepID=A0A8H6WYL7_9AGAR|nr:Isoflavone reductase family protein [Mycena venus]
MRKLYLPYTVIDVGYGYQISFPMLSFGRVDYASMLTPNIEIQGDGDMPTILTDLHDIGCFVALIIKNPCTLNKFVVAYGDVLFQNEVFETMEVLSGEKIEWKYVSADDIAAARDGYTTTLDSIDSLHTAPQTR